MAVDPCVLHRRAWLAGLAASGLHGLAAAVAPASTRQEVRLVTPGPGSAASLVAELASRTGCDRAEGLDLRLRFVTGGGPALRELINGNVEFGAFGLPAAIQSNHIDPSHPLVGLAALERRTPIALMVRKDLHAQIKRVADLRGRTIGVHSNAFAAVSTGQQIAHLLLRQAGVPLPSVRFIASGQTWESQSSSLRGLMVDALISEEPFAQRLEREGLALPLKQLGYGAAPAGDEPPGSGFLRGTLLTTCTLLAQRPDLAERMTRTVVRTLAWLHSHTPQEVVFALGYTGAESQSFQRMLEDFPQQYSRDGRFIARQLEDTDRFVRASLGDANGPPPPRAADLIDDRWVGPRT